MRKEDDEMKKYETPEIELIVLLSSECMALTSGDYEDKGQQDNEDFENFFGKN